MKNQIRTALHKAIEMEWITLNKHLDEDALVHLLMDAMKDTTIRNFLEDTYK